MIPLIHLSICTLFCCKDAHIFTLKFKEIKNIKETLTLKEINTENDVFHFEPPYFSIKGNSSGSLWWTNMVKQNAHIGDGET